MKTKSPPNRRAFRTTWDEITYLYDKIIFWFFYQGNRRQAKPFAERMAQLLQKSTPQERQSIFAQECQALLSELNGDLRTAIKHRQKEIKLIRKLHDRVRNTAHSGAAHRKYGYDALSDRLDLLTILQHDAGQLDEAIRTLQDSQNICKQHDIPFDGQQLLNDYLAERQSRNGASTKD